MTYNTHSALLDVIGRLCDSLTVALCNVEFSNREDISEVNREHLLRAENAIQKAGSIAWELQNINTLSVIFATSEDTYKGKVS